MTPDLALTYSSQGGVEIAGVGMALDLGATQIALNLHDGYRPRSVADDLERFAPGTPIDRYRSQIGTITVTDDGDALYLFDPTNDFQISPIADVTGSTDYNGENAAWRVRDPNGVSYRFGHGRHSSVWQDEAESASRRKVSWLLDEVSDTVGNKMRYYWDEYPLDQDVLRQPSLRAIEYGIEGGATGDNVSPGALVVSFRYKESPWKRDMRTLGTRTNFAFLIDEICVHQQARVTQALTPGGHIRWDVLETANPGPLYCYDFDYAENGYTGRPLLSSLSRVAHDGTRLPGWSFAYKHQGSDWRSAYRNALAAPAEDTFWTHSLPEPYLPLSTSTTDVTQFVTDLDGDGVADTVRGASDGDFPVFLGRDNSSDGESRVDSYVSDDWLHPLIGLAKMVLTGTLNSSPESGISDCWWKFDATLAWSGSGSGLGIANALTAAPPNFYDIYESSSANDEFESGFVDLGAFQFLSRSTSGPAPRSFHESPGNKAEHLSELSSFAEFKNTKEKESAYDYTTSGCEDAGDDFEVDYCWNAGVGGSGIVGSELGCLDAPGSRWFTQDSPFHGYSSQLWELRDMNGDSRPDWVFASHLAQRDNAGNLRDLSRNANDWLVAFGNGAGWDDPVWFSVPDKRPALSGVDFVHGTSLLSTSTSMSSRSAEKNEIGVNICPWSPVPVSPIIGGVPTSVGSAVSAAAATGLERLFGGDTAGNVMLGAGSLSSVNSIASGGGACVGVSSEGISVPIIGNIFRHLLGDEEALFSSQVQGYLDLDGDARPDLVSSRFDAGSSTNSSKDWLFYHNSGVEVDSNGRPTKGGFDEPVVWQFPREPTHPNGKPVSTLSETRTQQVTKVKWFYGDDPFENAAYAIQDQPSGLVDLNGDGLLDLVATQWVNYYRGPVGDSTYDDLHWYVYFNEGDDFSDAVAWPFDGGWDAPGCDTLHVAPSISQTVSYVDPSNDLARDVFGRQVMGLADVNGDGLKDFWFQQPYDGEKGVGKDRDCGYVPTWKSITHNSKDQWVSYSDPYSIKAPLMVALNTGSSFADAVEWVDPDLHPGAMLLSGSKGTVYPDGVGQKLTTQVSHGVVGAADLNADGIPELAAVRSLGGSQTNYDLLKLREGDPDLLEALTTPNGGQLRVDYRFHIETGGEMGQGIWVVDSTAEHEHDGTKLSKRSFEYEHGRFDPITRKFMGFERVYQQGEGQDGYTVSRYLQEDGFDSLLYCREVRKLEVAPPGEGFLTSLVEQKNREWATGVPSGYAESYVTGQDTTVSIAERIDAADGPPTGAPTERETSGGAIVDEAGWGPSEPEVDAIEDPNLDAEEETATELTNQDEDTAEYEGSVATLWYGGESAPAAPTHAIDSALAEPTSRAMTPAQSIDSVRDRAYLGTCTGPSSGMGVGYTCVAASIPHEVACADAGDPGIPVKKEVQIWRNLSDLPGLATPRLEERRELVYDKAGSNPRVRTIEYTYDSYGNVLVERDSGDVAKAGDDIVTTRRFAVNAPLSILAVPCHEQVKDGVGTTLKETWFDYDAASVASCSPAIEGLRTSTRYRVDPTSGFTETTAFDPATGLPISVIDGRGNTSSTTYHPDYPWLVTSKARAVNAAVAAGPTGAISMAPTTHALAMTYHGADTPQWQHFGLVATESDLNGNVTSRHYDKHGRPSEVVRPLDSASSPTVAISFDETVLPHRRTELYKIDSTDAKEHTVTFDGFGRIARESGSAPKNDVGATTVIDSIKEYDIDGRVVSRTLPHFVGATSTLTVTSAFDLLGRPTHQVFPNGSERVWQYDRDRVSERDEVGSLTHRVLDVQGREIQTSEYIGSGATLYRTTSREFRPDGPLQRIVDTNGNTWTFSHDLLGREIERNDPDAGRRGQILDENGNVIVYYDERFYAPAPADKRSVEVQYDEANRPLLRVEFSAATVTGTMTTGLPESRTIWFYDRDPSTLGGATISCPAPSQALGRTSRVDHYQRDGAGLALASRKELCYDERGQLIKEARTIAGTTYEYEYTYDGLGNVTSAVYPDGAIVGTDYDPSGRMVSMSASAGPIIDDTIYNAFGMIAKRHLGGGTLTEHACFEVGGQGGLVPHRIVAAEPTATVTCDPLLSDSVNDTVSDGGGLATIYRNVAYSYDDKSRIVSRQEQQLDPTAAVPVIHTSSYTYDEIGRLSTEVFDGTTHSFGYDVIDNPIDLDGVAQSYGASACFGCSGGPHALATTSSGHRLDYDAAGNVVRLESPSGHIYDLTLNGANLPLEVRRDGGAAVATYVYDDAGNRVRRLGPSSTTVYAGEHRVTGSDTESFYGQVAVKKRDASGDKLYFVLRDPVSSLSMMLDASGNVVQRADYSPFGSSRTEATYDPDPSDTFTPYASPDRLSGNERESIFAPEDEIYDFGARLYFASVGRWLSVDPVLEADLNRYSYVLNDPINRHDPGGREPVTIWVVAETAWTVYSISEGVNSIIEDGPNVWNVGGVVVDTVTLFVPGLPGGASVGVRYGDDALRIAARFGDDAIDYLRYSDEGVDALRAVDDAPLPTKSSPRTNGITDPPVGPKTKRTTIKGVKRNNPRDWRAFRDLVDELGDSSVLSEANRKLIAKGTAPIADDAWLKHFPDDIKGEKLTMHHVYGSSYVEPVGTSRHLRDGHGGNFQNPGATPDDATAF